ncbi:glycosyltransferase [Flavobacterium sp. 7A]|uniref:glycosyltransferase n=1 Tax=Flavobacterium sp. 7A TaxID=2940571 RepID=UPI0022268AFD|nr:glycosyltransferase [Flavobacterium sp. 7A]MCW2118500.1 glycosyltransferase involved in cell wall biosynthesis [Flavobacterium sp. 7A]
MKIIHYIASIDQHGGGTTEYMRLLSAALKDSCTLSIATGKSDHPIAIDGVPVRFFDSRVIRWYSLLKEFRNYLEEEKPDIVHINGIWSPQNWGFQKVAQQLNIKVILSPHGMLEPWIINHNPWKKKLAMALYQKKAIQNADYLHATAAMEEKSIKALGFSNPLVIIPNFIDTSEIKEVKVEYGSKKIIFISRIHPKKGIELLLEAWRKLDTTHWSLEIAGNGDQSYIDELKQSSNDLLNVHFVGPQYGEKKWEFIKSADIMVLPTHSENFGIVVVEALAVGVPVLTTKGTPWEDLELFNCGWWIDLSVLNLKSTLLDILVTPTTSLAEMGVNAKNLVREKYEIKQVIEKFYNLYTNI